MIMLISLTLVSAKSENSGGESGNSPNSGSSSNSANSGSSANSGKSESSNSNNNKGKSLSISSNEEVSINKDKDDDSDDVDDDNDSDDAGDDNDSDDDGDDSDVKKESKKSFEFESELEIEEESGKFKIKLSSGKQKDLDVEPELAKSIAFDKFKGDRFNITINESNGSVTYEAVAFKNGKFLWLFNKEVVIKASIDSVSGNVTIKKPWWALFVSGEDDDQSNSSKIVICHVPGGNPNNGQTITIGSPALKAHLKHGDVLGECNNNATNQTNQTNSTQPVNQTNNTQPGNITNQTNQSNQSSLAIALISPQNLSVHNSSIIPLEFSITNTSLAECFFNLDLNNQTTIINCENTSINSAIGNHSIYLTIKEGNNSAISNTHQFSIITNTSSENNSSQQN